MIKIDKRIILFIVITILFCASLQPIISGITIKSIQKDIGSIDQNSALKVALTKIKNLEKTDFEITTSNLILDDKGSTLCYVFDLNPKGYIVVPCYKTLPPILAYSFTSSFFEGGTLLYDLVREDLMLRLTHSSKICDNTKEEYKILWDSYLKNDFLKLENNCKQWPKEGVTISGGWLETEWNQNSPFNDFCPMDLTTGKRSVAGCPAVAMAQILNYHQTTNNIQFNDSDDYFHDFYNCYWIDNNYETYDFPSFPQLNNYLDNLVIHFQNDIALTDEDKASITFACGVACKQVYSSGVSGTYGVGQAYDAYKRFSFDDCELLTDDDPNVYERVQGNIMEGLPVHLAVVNEAWDAGHNLVIDGYREDGYYHLNFGWGGYYDGWYKIPEEIPRDLTVLEGLIVDIIDKNSDSIIHGKGVLYWPDVIPGFTVEGSFTIENVGEPGSSIDWEIITWPEWGDWSFDPASGENLTPEAGPLTIDVSVIAPDKKGKHFSGYVKIVDVEDNINSCLIHVSLSTPRIRGIFSFLDFLFERNLNSYPLFWFLFNQ
jgi:hypothetical protein